MRIEPEIAGVSLVLLGRFNPVIFTPAWFGWHQLLPRKIIEIADTNIAHPQITRFNADWLNIQVVPERIQIITSQPPYVRIRDLVVRIFREHLHHTPLTTVGINRDVHFCVQDHKQRDQLGKLLAPVEPWGDWARKLDLDGERGGMVSLTMRQVNPCNRPAGGQINVKVEPSNMVAQEHLGVYVGVNDHYVVGDVEPQMQTRKIVELIEEKFDDSLRRADEIIDHIMSLTEEQ